MIGLKSLICLAFLVLAIDAQVTNVAVRSITVKGTLKCGNKPAPDITVKLYRVDSKDENQVLDTRTSGPSGMFEVTSNTNGRPINETDLEPIVRFFHRCDTSDDKKKDSSRTFHITVPKDQVTLGKTSKKTFDVGTLNLELQYPKESWEKTVKRN